MSHRATANPLAVAEVRLRWRADAARMHFGRCYVCERLHTDDGKPLLVTRQTRARRFLCFDCYLATPRRRPR